MQDPQDVWGCSGLYNNRIYTYYVHQIYHITGNLDIVKLWQIQTETILANKIDELPKL